MVSHTDWSNLCLRDSTNTISSVMNYAIQLDHKVLAFTEHETIANAIKIEQQAKKIKEKAPDLKIIRGNEIYLTRNELSKDNYVSGQDRFWHFILLAKDAEGHKQIRELSTRAWQHSWMQGKMRRRPTYYSDLEEIIGKNPGHVIGSSACLGGWIPTQWLKYLSNDDKEVLAALQKRCKYFKELFGQDHFYLELQPSAETGNEQFYANLGLLTLSKELDIPAIITTDSHYLTKDKAPIHEAFLNAQDGDREVSSFYATTYMMNDEEIRGYIQDYIDEEDIQNMYQNIMKVADMCEDYSLQKPLKIPSLKWKEVPPSPSGAMWIKHMPYLSTFLNSDFEGDRRLAFIIMDRLDHDEALQNKETYDEINNNLEMIWVSSEVNKAHWSAYLLNLQNIIDVCWQAGSIVGPGRGSGVGFLLNYILDITQINPLWETTKTFAWRLTVRSKAS